MLSTPGQGPGTRPLLFVQYGDFAADHRRLGEGGAETYQSQRRSVNAIARTARADRPLVVVNMVTERAAGAAIAPHITVVGLGPDGPATGWRAWWRLLDRLDPARIVLRTPILPVLAWAAARRRPTLAVLADSFDGRTLRRRLRRAALARLLSSRAVDYVGNHGRASAFQLAAMGVPADRIVPWDIVPAHTPLDHTAKPGIAAGRPVRLMYAAALSPAKGADDVVAAMGVLRQRGVDATLTMLGGGDQGRIRTLADAHGVADRIDLPGIVPNDRMFAMIRAADIMIVPSRPDYAEGLPLAIYESFAARTPLVASDHPMFVSNIRAGTDAAIFPAGDAAALADRIATLAADPARYVALSEATLPAWMRLQLPVGLEDLVDRWLAGDRAWLDRYTLARHDYGMA